MEYQHLKTAQKLIGRGEKPFPVRSVPFIPTDERVVDALIQLTFATKLHRMIITGPKCVETLLELHRRGYLRATTAALCDVPCGQFDVALVAGREHSIEALETTLNRLVHFLSTAGLLVVWVTPPDRTPIQLLRLALSRLGFRIEAGTACEIGVVLSARRMESIVTVA
jgi:hypothetical protein